MSRGPIACFTDLLSRWLKWAPPNHQSPTLETLAEALRVSAVGEEKLANDLIQGFQPTSSSEVMSKPITSQSQLSPALGCSFNLVPHQSVDSPTLTSIATTSSAPSVKRVKTKIHEFEQRFNALKKSTRGGLELQGIEVKEVVECLTNIPADDKPDHEVFLEKHVDKLKQEKSIWDVFICMNSYWNYLAYHLLEHLIKELSVEEVKGEMEKYESDLQQFMLDTPLEVFCKAQKKRVVDVPPGFKKMVVKFVWPQNVTLAVVETFRQQYAYKYNLHKCAMMVITIRRGSFTVVWAIPESIAEVLKMEMAEDIFSKYVVSRLDIAEVCVYEQMSTPSDLCIGGSPSGAANRTRLLAPYVHT